jgi:hypothetical protein
MPQPRDVVLTALISILKESGPLNHQFTHQFIVLKAVHLSLKAFANTLVNKPVQIATDNTTVVAYINREAPNHGNCVLFSGESSLGAA